MSTWNIVFVIQKVSSEVSLNHKREVLKNETVANIEVMDTDLNLILKCKDANAVFCNEELFDIDRKNIAADEIEEKMIKEYYVTSYKLDFTNKTGEIKLTYPKINLI